MKRPKTALEAMHAAALKRIDAHDGERGVALMSVMLFMILLSGMSLVLLSVILAQIGPSYAAQKSTKTVYAAQGGLQAALGVLRTAAAPPDATGAVYGARNLLPCQISGSVDGGSGDITYTVDVSYYLADPTGQTDAWLALASNKLACSSPGGVTTQPNYAYLVSRGTGAANAGRSADEGNRAVAAVYKFQVTRENIPSGRILDFTKANCLQAQPLPSGLIGPGSTIRFVPAASCTNDARELWIYAPTYQLQLAKSVEDASPLCISGPALSGETTQKATLVACAPPGAADSVRYKQLWVWSGSHTWLGQTNPVTRYASNACLSSLTESSLKYLAVNTPCGTNEKFAPTPSVGSGAASKVTNQVVNFKEFGRCFDVTGESSTASYMIVYPCKQDPASTNGTYVLWNHKLYYDEPTAPATSKVQTLKIKNISGGTEEKCLQTPENTTAGKYVKFETCVTSAGVNKDRQTWTRVQDTGVYADSFLFKDFYGRCMTADDTPPLHDSNWSKVTVVACNAGLAQKWNAPASYDTATFGSFKELG